MSAPTPELFDFLVMVSIGVSLALAFLLWLAYSIGFDRGRAGRSAVDHARGYERGRLAAMREVAGKLTAAGVPPVSPERGEQ